MDKIIQMLEEIHLLSLMTILRKARWQTRRSSATCFQAVTTSQQTAGCILRQVK